MLKILVCLPIIGIILNNLLYSYNKKKPELLGIVSIIITILVLYISFWIYITMNNNNNEFQYREIIDLYYIRISLGVDGVSISIILIITLIFPILMLLNPTPQAISTYNTSPLPSPTHHMMGGAQVGDKNRELGEMGNSVFEESVNDYVGIINILLIMESILIIIFLSLDILLFFIMFELILIPMFILIGKYGSRVNKIEAAYRFIIYTMIGSLVMLISIIILYMKFGTTNIEVLNLKISHLLEGVYPNNNLLLLKIIWLFIFFSFMIKIPMFPFHTWLPEAHTEAPTIGSIILAAILLKLGTFGIYRYSLYLFNSGGIGNIYSYYLPIILILSLLSIYYCSLIAIRSVDLKKIIAYSSIVHMNFSIFGFFSEDILGFTGSTFLMFSHAFVSSALFLLIGILYKRYHSRIIYYYKGLVLTMPLFASFFFFFSLANISLPFTSSFLAEILIILSSFKLNLYLTILLSFSLIFSSCYVIFLANRILFGNLTSVKNISLYLDLSFNEFLSLSPMLLFTILFGIYPKPLFDLFSLNLINIIY